MVRGLKQTLSVICKCYPRRVCLPCLVCLMLWAAAVCLTVAGYEDVGQASGSGDFCKGGYGTAVAAAASAQNKPASSVTGPGVGECRHMPNETKNPFPPVFLLVSPTILLLSLHSFLCLMSWSLMSCPCKTTRDTMPWVCYLFASRASHHHLICVRVLYWRQLFCLIIGGIWRLKCEGSQKRLWLA